MEDGKRLKLSASVGEREENNVSPISTVNDYCLKHIFTFLPMIDRIRIQRGIQN